MSGDILNDIYARLRRVGAAIARINGNNTHSGNLSMRHPHDQDVFYITSSGSQCGSLVLQDIVPVRFSGVSWGDARGSTESTIHRRILSLPGSSSVIHAHYLNSTFISFDHRDVQLFLRYTGKDARGREEFTFHPVDLFGAFAVGCVRVGSYFQPVGSAEMEERIPGYLERDRMTLVRGHGSFVRGASPEEALYLLSVLESSAKLVLLLRRRGVDVVRLQKAIVDRGVGRFFPGTPHLFNDIDFALRQVDDVTMSDDFHQRLLYNYNNQLSAFATGSMSQKISAAEMIYCPLAAIPEEFDFPLLRIDLAPRQEDCLDVKIHKLIYRHTHLNACMITTSPLITAEGMAILAEKFGAEALLGETANIPYSSSDHPLILPIDAEAIYLNPRLGLVDITRLADMTAENPILDMLRRYKGCCVVAGYGVISAGETTLEQAAHNAASAERIAQFRAEVFINEKVLNGPPLADFEPKSVKPLS